MLSKVLFEFQRCGEDLFRQGINNSHSGNMSICDGTTIYITRSGSQLNRLQWSDIIETSLHYIDTQAKLASVELIVHRAIYQRTSAKAIIHSHPPHAIARSFMTDEIKPIDAEGQYHLKKVPVLSVKDAISSEEVAEKIPGLLIKSPVVVVKGHGSFATAANLEKCLLLTSSLESACKIEIVTNTIKEPQ